MKKETLIKLFTILVFSCFLYTICYFLLQLAIYLASSPEEYIRTIANVILVISAFAFVMWTLVLIFISWIKVFKWCFKEKENEKNSKDV